MTTAARGTVASAIVETFDQQQVAGWIEEEAGGAAVQVTLCVNDVDVDSTWAVDAAPRRGSGTLRNFRFALHDLWDYVTPSDQVSVRIDGRPVPIAGAGTYVSPARSGAESLTRLQELLAAGHIFNPDGRLQLSKTVDVAWQEVVLGLQARVHEAVRELRDYETFLIYGTLLGAVRDGGFIGHDREFDCAYLSTETSGPAAARELQAIAFALIDRGFRVHATDSALHIADAESGGVRLNLFHLFFAAGGTLQFPFGVAGTEAVQSDAWTGTTETTLGGATVRVPARAEAVLEQIYGPDWRTPNPGFTWSRDRTGSAPDAILPAPVIEEIYWADFYANTTYNSGSTFFELVNGRSDTPATVIDIGCGDGRDSFAFARAGRRATGVDRSHIGIRLAAKKAAELGLSDSLRFAACDVGAAELLRTVLTEGRVGDEPVVYYARFFLHSIPEDVQRTLLSVIEECARPGDYLACEFRTDADEANSKVHGDHYRRFQNGRAFGRNVRETYGFDLLLEQEGNGFSPYKGEDPQLYRVIARRRDT
jgi:SAM-dependent methyltransferase